MMPRGIKQKHGRETGGKGHRWFGKEVIR